MLNSTWIHGGVAGLVLVVLIHGAWAHEPHRVSEIGEQPAIPAHVSQAAILNGSVTFEEIVGAGERLFSAQFNKLDGQGRPAATGHPAHTKRVVGHLPDFIRTGGPDANSCAGCHNQPRVGGAGEFVSNVFVLAQLEEGLTDSVAAEFSNERNTLGMMGAGPIELLAREMTAELFEQRKTLIKEAQAAKTPVTKVLEAKGVTFGKLTALPNGLLDTSKVEGIDEDLIVKPFHQKGVSRSLREFSINAMNHHHGMQPVERFGYEETKSRDYDQDGVPDELSEGDITAISIFQAQLNTPGRVLPRDPAIRAAIVRGERRFSDLGCASCHLPVLVLDDPKFCEPYAFNLTGTLNDPRRSYCVDLSTQGELPRPERTTDGKLLIKAYTDLKRHVICDKDIAHFCNEKKRQAGVAQNQFLTRKLWDVGNSAPYGHRGDLTTLTEAILCHGGEGRKSRDAFAVLKPTEQADVIEFLKSLQVLPAGAPLIVDNAQVAATPIGTALPLQPLPETSDHAQTVGDEPK